MSDARDGYLDADRRFAERIRDMRVERGWSQELLASKMVDGGVHYATQSTVSRIEKQLRPVRVSEATVLLSIFGVRSLYEMTADDQRLKWILPLRKRAAEGMRRFLELGEARQAMKEAIKSARHDLGLIERLRLDGDDLPEEMRADVESLQLALTRLTYIDVDSFVDFSEESDDGSPADTTE